MKKKLILFIPSIEGGGVEKNLYIIANYLAKKIYAVSLITVTKDKKKKFNNRIKFIAPNQQFWNKLNKKIKYIYCLYLLFLEILKNRNILVFSFQANIYCILLCKFFNIKIIVRSNSSPSGWSKNFLKNLIFSKILKKADAIIVNSYAFKNELIKKFKVRPVCIYNPLNIKEINKKSKSIRMRNFFSDKKILKIINVGRFTDQKDHITLLKTMNNLKNKINFELLIVGRGVNKTIIHNYITENNLKKFVKIVNYKKNPYPYIKQSDLFILSSRFEGLPNVLLEALVLNKFVISSNCPTGPAEILDNGKGGLLFKVGDYKDLEKKIKYFLLNKKACIKKIKYAKKRLNRFDYKYNLNKYNNIVQKHL